MLNKIQSGGVDALKAVKLLHEQGKISTDCVLMVDEMYHQKAAQYQNGEYVSLSNDGDIFKGTLVFMIAGLKESVPYAIKAIPEVQYSGQSLATETAECIHSLGASGFNVRCVVNDNHFANVNSFKCLHNDFQNDSNLCMQHPGNGFKKTYLFYDSVYLLKNICNSLLHTKKLVFPAFNYDKNGVVINCPDGYITWADFIKFMTEMLTYRQILKKLINLHINLYMNYYQRATDL